MIYGTVKKKKKKKKKKDVFGAPSYTIHLIPTKWIKDLNVKTTNNQIPF